MVLSSFFFVATPLVILAWPFFVGLLAVTTEKRASLPRILLAWVVALCPPLAISLVGIGFLQLGWTAFAASSFILVAAFVVGAFVGALVKTVRSKRHRQ